MSATTPIATKEQLLLEISNIIKTMLPDITSQARAGIEDGLKRLFSSGLEAEKKTGTNAISEIATASAKALEALKKELEEAEAEIADKKKSVMQAYSDAFTDWSKAMNQPKLAEAFSILPDIQKNMEDVIAAGKAIKSRTDITVNATKLIVALVGEAITVLMLVVMILE